MYVVSLSLVRTSDSRSLVGRHNHNRPLALTGVVLRDVE